MLIEFVFVSLQRHILGYIKDLFDFDTSDYSSVESLCDSIVRLAKERGELLVKSHGNGTEIPADSFGEMQSLTIQDLQEVEQC